MKYIPINQLTLIRRDIFRLEKLELLPLNHEVAEMEEGTSDEDDENMDSDDDVPKEVGSEDEDEDNED